jgi:ribonuclease P protein subunit RPR2
MLIAGVSSACFIENKSRGGKKPWADVLVVRCQTCSHETRYPVGQQPAKKPEEPEKAAAGT